jgi:hypothetical protein
MDFAMTSASWALRAWPPVLWQADCDSPPQFLHVDTRVLSNNSTSAGQTVWAAPLDDGEEVGIAWDWVQLPRGVVALADPMSVVSNLRVMGPDGGVLTAWQAARHLNHLVHGLPWQREVSRALGLPEH